MILVNIDRKIGNSCCFAADKMGVINAVSTDIFERNKNINRLEASISYILRAFSTKHPYIRDIIYLFKNDESFLTISKEMNMIENTLYYLRQFIGIKNFEPIRGFYYISKGFKELTYNNDVTLSSAFLSRASDEFNRAFSLISDEKVLSHIQYILSKIYIFLKEPRLARLCAEEALEIDKNNLNAIKSNIFLTETYHPMKAVQEYISFLNLRSNDLDCLLRLFFIFDRFGYAEKARKVVLTYIDALQEFLEHNIAEYYIPEKMKPYIQKA